MKWKLIMMKKIIFSSAVLLLISLIFVGSCKPVPKDRTAEKQARRVAFKAMYSEAYFIALKDSLQIDDYDIKSLKSFNATFKYQIRQLRLKNELTPEKRKTLRKARNTKERETIGRPLYIKKIEFDKEWLVKMKEEKGEKEEEETEE